MDTATETKHTDAINIKRYEVDSFKTTSAKRVPCEELDYSIYKESAKMVVFATTEERLPQWIRMMILRYKYGLKDNNNISILWKEQDDVCNAAKCGKIKNCCLSPF